MKGNFMMNRKWMIVTTLVLGLMIFNNGIALSQSPSTGSSTDTLQVFIEKIRADKKLIVSTVLELTDAEAKAFWPVYESYQKELYKLHEATAKLIIQFAENYQSMSDSAADKLIKDTLALDAKRNQMKKDFLPKFSKAISKIKVLKYYQLENKIQMALSYDLSLQIPMLR